MMDNPQPGEVLSVVVLPYGTGVEPHELGSKLLGINNFGLP